MGEVLIDSTIVGTHNITFMSTEMLQTMMSIMMSVMIISLFSAMIKGMRR